MSNDNFDDDPEAVVSYPPKTVPLLSGDTQQLPDPTLIEARGRSKEETTSSIVAIVASGVIATLGLMNQNAGFWTYSTILAAIALGFSAVCALVAKNNVATCPLCKMPSDIAKPSTGQSDFTCPTCKIVSKATWSSGSDKYSIGQVTATSDGFAKAQTLGTVARSSIPGQGCGALLGCSLLFIAALGGMALIFDTHLSGSQPAPAWPSPPPIAVENMTPEHQLASINAGSILPPTDPSVAQFRALLDRTRQQFPSQTDKNIADKWVYTWQQIKQREPNLSLLKFAQGMSSIDMHGTGR